MPTADGRSVIAPRCFVEACSDGGGGSSVLALPSAETGTYRLAAVTCCRELSETGRGSTQAADAAPSLAVPWTDPNGFPSSRGGSTNSIVAHKYNCLQFIELRRIQGHDPIGKLRTISHRWHGCGLRYPPNHWCLYVLEGCRMSVYVERVNHVGVESGKERHLRMREFSPAITISKTRYTNAPRDRGFRLAWSLVSILDSTVRSAARDRGANASDGLKAAQRRLAASGLI